MSRKGSMWLCLIFWLRMYIRAVYMPSMQKALDPITSNKQNTKHKWESAHRGHSHVHSWDLPKNGTAKPGLFKVRKVSSKDQILCSHCLYNPVVSLVSTLLLFKNYHIAQYNCKICKQQHTCKGNKNMKLFHSMYLRPQRSYNLKKKKLPSKL